jgi:hypothetical protein
MQPGADMGASQDSRSPSHSIPARALTEPSLDESRRDSLAGHGSVRRRVTETSAAASRPETEAELRAALAEWSARPPGDVPAWCRFSVDRLLERVIWTREERRQAGRIVRWYVAALPAPVNFDDFGRDEYERGDELNSEGEADARITEPVKDENGTNKRRGMSKEEANHRARDILREYPEISVRELARRIGCSTGLVSQLIVYRMVRERLDSDAQPKKPKTVSLSDDLLAMTGRDDEALKRLIEEQEADSEPSPLEDDESRKPNRVFRPK